VERIADPGFMQGVTMTRVLGTLALRMANADVLPFRFSHYAARLEAALRDVPTWGDHAAGQGAPPLDVAPLLASANRALQLATSLEGAIGQRHNGHIRPMQHARSTIDSRGSNSARRRRRRPDSRWYRHVFYGWNIYCAVRRPALPRLAEAMREDVARA
jgi:N-acetylated-alpha-linked acidic dipeptidase